MKLLLGLMLTTFAFSAMAQEARNLEVTTVVQKQIVETKESGEVETQLVTADAVSPGETVYYTITFRNVGDASADNVVITNPIADSLLYVDGSAFGPGSTIEFSVDDGKTFAVAAELVVTENGEVRAAEAGDFTHVRWLMQNDLAVGAQGIARFAAVLE